MVVYLLFGVSGVNILFLGGVFIINFLYFEFDFGINILFFGGDVDLFFCWFLLYDFVLVFWLVNLLEGDLDRGGVYLRGKRFDLLGVDFGDGFFCFVVLFFLDGLEFLVFFWFFGDISGIGIIMVWL